MATGSIHFSSNFYTTMMRDYDKHVSITVEHFDGQDACEAGGNYTCDVQRVALKGYKTVEGKNEDYAKSVIIKTLPKSEARVALYRSQLAMENEFQAYDKIIPELLHGTADAQLPLPACYFAAQDIIALEDLTLQGFHNVKKDQAGLGLQHGLAVAETLAKLHSASLVLENNEPGKLKTLAALVKETLFHGGESPLLISQQRFIEFALNYFKNMNPSDDQEKAVQLLQKLHDSSTSIVQKLMMNARKYPVFNHGDAWMGNILIDKDDNVRLIDLQQMRLTSVAADLSFLVYVNLKPRVWVQHLPYVLEWYLHTLHEHIRACGLNMDAVLTKEWLNKEMADYAIYGLMRALWIGPTFFYKPEDVDLSNVSVELLSDMAFMLEKIGPEYTQWMKDLVLNFVKHSPGQF